MRKLPLFALALCLCAAPALAASEDTPHPHQGVVTPYNGAPPVLALSADDLATLATGAMIKKQIEAESGGRGIVVQDVNASPEVIWSRITRYDKYPQWVSGVLECAEYENQGERIKVRFLVGAMGTKVAYYVDHVYKPAEGWMTWTLDYTRESDLDDSVGFWRVEALPEKPGWSRVTYSVDVRLRGWVPGFIETLIAKRGLTQATEWVKREAEAIAGG